MKMDNIIREQLNKIRHLNETAEETSNGIPVDGNDPQIQEIQSNIRKFVGALKVDEKAEIVYPKEGDVVFNGAITDMNNLKFQFRYKDQGGGLYVWSESLLLTKDVTEKLSKLVMIKEQWKTYWAENISQFENRD